MQAARQAYGSLILLSLRKFNSDGASEFWRQVIKRSHEVYHFDFSAQQQVRTLPWLLINITQWNGSIVLQIHLAARITYIRRGILFRVLGRTTSGPVARFTGPDQV